MLVCAPCSGDFRNTEAACRNGVCHQGIGLGNRNLDMQGHYHHILLTKVRSQSWAAPWVDRESLCGFVSCAEGRLAEVAASLQTACDMHGTGEMSLQCHAAQLTSAALSAQCQDAAH